MIKKGKILLFALKIITVGLVFASCEEEAIPQYLTMSWGIADEVTAFKELPREPQGLDVTRTDEDTLQVTWEINESYVLPLSATSNKELEGVRYLGSGIPDQLELEWLDPREEIWYPLEEIPEEKVKVIIEDENEQLAIDFGPPEGADFEKGMTRLIWFRITPTEAIDFQFDIHGYLSEEDDIKTPVSNTLILQAEVSP